MKQFKTIKNNSSAEIIEKKSKFIANVFYVENAQEAEDCINKIKKENYNAKHNCFAYIVMGENGERIKKSSDDGEPSGTAGAPMLEILEKQNLCNVLVVVTRYFGGIKLGAGPLTRAYAKIARNVINSNNLSFNYLNYCYKNNYKIINSTNLLQQILDIF